MIKCGVCGSENEAAALFCGTCGSPLSPAEAKEIVYEATKTTVSETATTDESVVPGKGGARRDLGTGGQTAKVPLTPPTGGGDAEVAITDADSGSGGPTIVCSVCGTVNDATRTYCRKCANELKPAPPPPPPPPPRPAARRISPLAIGLGAAAVVVAVALIAVLVMGGGPGASLSPTARASQGTSPSAGPTTPEVTTEPTPTQRTFTEGDLSGQIAFARCPAGGDCSINLRPADSSANARRIIGATDASALDPAISHDGKRIVYRVEPGLRIVTIATGKFVQHSTGPGDTNPFWSPDDSQITFAGHRARDPGSADSDLEVRLDGIAVGGSSTPLTNNDVVDHDPVFTPDGGSIVWIQGEGDGRELKRLEIATGNVTDLTTDAFADEDPAVSPDGTEVVFTSTRGSGSEYDLFLLNLSTLEITALPTMSGDEHDPAWSPGGRYIVFSGGTKGSEDLFILDLANGSFTPFTTAGGADLAPSWQ